VAWSSLLVLALALFLAACAGAPKPRLTDKEIVDQTYVSLCSNIAQAQTLTNRLRFGASSIDLLTAQEFAKEIGDSITDQDYYLDSLGRDFIPFANLAIKLGEFSIYGFDHMNARKWVTRFDAAIAGAKKADPYDCAALSAL